MPITYVSWNIKQFGEKKQKPGKQPPAIMGATDVAAIANVIRACNADVVAIMEVTTVSGVPGVTQVMKDLGWTAMATSNDATAKPDRYAVIWNPATIDFRGFDWPTETKTGAQLKFANRHPALFRLTAKAGGGRAKAVDFSALLLHGPEPKEPGNAAAKTLASLADLKVVATPPEPTIISGDFNVDYTVDTAPYAPLVTAGYHLCLTGQRTSLKQKFNSKKNPGTHLSCAYDNVYLSQPLAGVMAGGVIGDFVSASATAVGLPSYATSTPQQQAEWQKILTSCRSRVSDHLPVAVMLNI